MLCVRFIAITDKKFKTICAIVYEIFKYLHVTFYVFDVKLRVNA